MSIKIKQATDRISRDVPKAEASIDEALVSVSALMSSLVQARLETGVPAVTGQAAIRRLAKAQMSLVEASSDVLRMHGELARIGREFAAGDLHECPPLQASSVKDFKLTAVV